MAKPWETDSCEQLEAHFAYYHVPVAAMLWCGVPFDQVESELTKALPHPSVRGVLVHPYIRCLEPRCRVLHNAIDEQSIPCSRENGKSTSPGEHVAPERRHVSRNDLKEWIAREFPADKPNFLFDEVERSTHTSINADSYRALQADRDALKARIEKATEAYRTLRQERDTIEGQRASLAAIVDKSNVPGDRAETTYLNIIGGLLALMRGKSPAGVAQSVFSSEAAIISALLSHHCGRPGISSTTLEAKFAEAKRSIRTG